MNIELNKIAGAALGTLLMIVSVNMASGIIFAPKKPAIPGYDLPGAEVVAVAAGLAAVADEPIAKRLEPIVVPDTQGDELPLVVVRQQPTANHRGNEDDQQRYE